MSRSVSGIDGDFSRKLPNFLTPVYFAPPLTGFPLEFGTGAGIKKTRSMELLDGQKSFNTYLTVRHNIPACNGQTDGQTYLSTSKTALA